MRSATNAFHAWLPLADGWTRGEFAARLREIGIGVVTSDAFAAGPPGEGVRLSLGAAYDVATTERSLRSIADILSQTPDLTSPVV